MSLYEQFWDGVNYRRAGHQNPPESASEAFQRGFGMECAAEDADPPIKMESIDDLFREVFDCE